MVVNEIGGLLIGTVFGWLLMGIWKKKGMDWKSFIAVVSLVVGGSGISYFISVGLVGYFWIGIFAGFVANVVVGVKWPNVRGLYKA